MNSRGLQLEVRGPEPHTTNTSCDLKLSGKMSNTCCLAPNALAHLLSLSLPRTLGQSQRAPAGTGQGGRCHDGRLPRVDAPDSWASRPRQAHCWPPGPRGCLQSTLADEEGGRLSCESLNSGCHTSDPVQKSGYKIHFNSLKLVYKMFLQRAK